jgi:polar amino acid transport system substrate-binding protein
MIQLLKSALMIGCLSLFVVACDTQPEANAPKITVVTCADNPPMEFYRHGEMTGFDIDFAHKLAEVLKVQVEIKDMDFGGMISALQSGRADMAIADMSATEERRQAVDFSIPYHHGGAAFLSLKSQEIKQWEDLSGRTLGVQMGSVWERTAQERQKDFAALKIFAGSKLGLLIEDLKAGRIHGIFLEAAAARQFAVQNPELMVTLLKEGSSAGSAVALPTGSPWLEKVNAAIAELKQSGWFEEAERKWFAE